MPKLLLILLFFIFTSPVMASDYYRNPPQPPPTVIVNPGGSTATATADSTSDNDIARGLVKGAFYIGLLDGVICGVTKLFTGTGKSFIWCRSTTVKTDTGSMVPANPPRYIDERRTIETTTEIEGGR